MDDFDETLKHDHHILTISTLQQIKYWGYFLAFAQLPMLPNEEYDARGGLGWFSHILNSHESKSSVAYLLGLCVFLVTSRLSSWDVG